MKTLRKLAPPAATVPRLWPSSTIACIASGPSLTREDVEFCRGRARVVCVNDSYRLASWADALYAADGAWWQKHWDENRYGLQQFAGLKFYIGGVHRWLDPSIQRLRNTGGTGLELQPTGLRTGGNSGFQALNLAVHFGASRIVLLGYDMQQTNGKAHWFGKHSGLRDTNPAQYPAWCKAYETLVKPLASLNVSVVNCSIATALTAFPRASLAETLAACEVAA